MDIKTIKGALLNGATILYETDTVVGLGCDARSEEAILKISEIKERPLDKSYIVLVANEIMLQEIVGDLSEEILEMMSNQDRPTTFIFPKFYQLASNLSGDHQSLAVRWTQNKALQSFIENLGFPLVSTSANLSGHAAALTIEEVDPLIREKVDIIYPQSFNGTQQASRIIKILGEKEFEIIRE